MKKIIAFSILCFFTMKSNAQCTSSATSFISNIAINISLLKAGIYFLELINKENNTIIKMISIEN